jgi:energy-converting hydrogenase Eha subunit E
VSSTSLIPIPAGCPVPDRAAVVFTGIMVAKDDITQTVRFGIDQIRAGTADPWAGDGLIDIRYGPDYRFLVKGETYLVGAGIDPRYNVLASTVRPPEPTFGGNDVIGVDDQAIDCPEVDDPIRTLNVDGTTVDSGVLSLMTQDRRLLLATFMVPLGIVILALLALVLLRAFGAVAFRGLVGLGRAALTPVVDHRATRVRKHRPREVYDWSGGPDHEGSDASERSDPSGAHARN